ncbi:D-beta-hydroxybutyrate dehydrogenase, mitochondrial [Nelusetta ayraudi]|uniref:D-beta-hydroxybutyrate dehydrogenase, mitochondrial n=1 Tax=Nelusetta ayraudi TaxID=303726 RepID=UPI003F7281B5
MSSALLVGQAVGCLSVSVLLLWLFVKAVWHRGEHPPQDGHGHGVLITGCDSGFGFELAHRLDQQGFTVFAGCLRAEGPGARGLAQLCSSSLQLLQLDVTQDQDVAQSLRMVQEQLPHKGLWAVVNNAGISDWAEIEWSSVQDFQHMLDINLFGAIRTSIAFLPLVRASRGRMLFTSSIFSFFTCLNMASYSVSKRGLEAFADCLRVEMASFGVKVSIIQPGNFGRATNIIPAKTASDIWDKLDEEKKKVFNQRYIRLAHDYFNSTCRSGFQSVEPVVEAMLHAVVSPRPRCRYLLASPAERFFFSLLPLLPTSLVDSIFTLSPMYACRRELLYNT